MAVVLRDLDAAWEQASDLAPELDSELHSAPFGKRGLPSVLRPIDE
jgi:hypothetical protein